MILGLTAVVLAMGYVPILADPAVLGRWVLLALVLVGVTTWQVLRGMPMLPQIAPGVAIPLLLWVLLAAISCVWAPDRGAAWVVFGKLWVGVQFFILASQCRLASATKWMVGGLGLAAGLVSVVGLLQARGIELGLDQIAPPAATFMNKNLAAQFLVGAVPGFLLAGLRGRASKKWAWLALGLVLAYLWEAEVRGAWLALAFAAGGCCAEWKQIHGRVGFREWALPSAWLVSILGVALPFARLRELCQDPPILGLSVLLVVFILGFGTTHCLRSGACNRWFSRFAEARMRLAGLAFLMLTVYVVAWLTKASWLGWLADVTNPDAHVNTSQVRLALYANGLAMVSEHPFFGIGLGQLYQTYPLYNHAVMPTPSMSMIAIPSYLHQDLLQVGVELGLPGLALVVVWIVQIFRSNHGSEEEKGNPPLIHRLAFWGWVAIGLHSFVSFPLQQPASAWLFWVFAGLLARSPPLLEDQGKPWRARAGKVLMAIVTLAVGVSFGIWAYASFLLARANHHLQKGELDQGYTLTAQAHRIFPADPQAVDQLVTLASRYAGNRQQALTVVDAFLQRYPNHPNGHFRKAFILKSMGAYQQALEAATSACELATLNPEPWLLKGLIYRDMDLAAQAEAAFREVLARNPSHGPGLEQLRQLGVLPGEEKRE